MGIFPEIKSRFIMHKNRSICVFSGSKQELSLTFDFEVYVSSVPFTKQVNQSLIFYKNHTSYSGRVCIKRKTFTLGKPDV